MNTQHVSPLLLLVAIVCFVLSVFAPVAGVSIHDWLGAGLAFFAAAHLVP